MSQLKYVVVTMSMVGVPGAEGAQQAPVAGAVEDRHLRIQKHAGRPVEDRAVGKQVEKALNETSARAKKQQRASCA